MSDGELERLAIQYCSTDEVFAHSLAAPGIEMLDEALRLRVRRERRWFQTSLAAARQLTPGVRNPLAAPRVELGASGIRVPDTRIPDEVFRQAKSGIATFLRHLWATDGCLWANQKHLTRLSYSSPSESFAADVQSLLLRLGIASRRKLVSIGSNGQPMYDVDISRKADIERFLALVGSVGSRKSAAPIPNGDTVPAAAWRSLVISAMQDAGVPSGVASAQLAALATRDVEWDEVASIELDGEERVFDLTVEGLHNFVAEDIVVHNSIEQDSDLVMFLYRDEYYNENSEDQGLAEVILAKHRNGPIGTEKLAFLKRFAKFSDLAPNHDARVAAA